MSQVNEKLNVILSDAIVMFAKVHNYHWNIGGVEFYGLHGKTQEIYEYFATLYDDVAERILQLEGTPVVTLKKALALATIKEEEKTAFNASYVLKSLLDDYQIFHRHFKELSGLEGIDSGTGGLADQEIATLEKEIWMLKSGLRS